MIDLNAYLNRINITGSVDNDYDSLCRVVLAHACKIPFENIDVFSGQPISLNIADIEAKLVRSRRGGYCFEQNALLAQALSQVGFSVQQLSGRVWYNTPIGTVPPRTHLFLVVDLDGRRLLADVGVGGSTPAGVMEFDLTGRAQTVGHEIRRLVPIPDKLIPTFMHQVQHDGQWIDIYEFTGESMPKIDQEMGNWWTSTHPDSKFRKNLIVAKLNSDGTRCSLINTEFVHRDGATVITRAEIASQEQLEQILSERFGLEIARSRLAMIHQRLVS
jgi:N-hydroxyarylamine O-acetyltransferase